MALDRDYWNCNRDKTFTTLAVTIKFTAKSVAVTNGTHTPAYMTCICHDFLIVTEFPKNLKPYAPDLAPTG